MSTVIDVVIRLVVGLGVVAVFAAGVIVVASWVRLWWWRRKWAGTFRGPEGPGYQGPRHER